ncbi:Deoxyribose-phosphate aldolase [Enhygromyxa salina]|uniref:Deoxyribose-phosphate aldolase n=1 Tax=Enhygromyxa salina TaxID=215803 RepID=A0A0C1ZYM0_9BACT|nr:deoxyribose-phosphate aldolase [Enhygromyxa salina]KIG16308.1 Deoxyribose-phosphate aldolase [Enhygromyxa salina]
MSDVPRAAAELARLIDHTLLAPTATAAAIDQLCAQARTHGLFSVCVNPCWAARAKQQLDGSEVRVCTVIGFPLGANATAGKAAEARVAVDDGADELDMVMNVGWLLDGREQQVRDDIAAVVDAGQGRVVKVILEIALLDEQAMIARACELAVAGGASFVKTSTGFGPGGATLEAVRVMRRTVGETIGVKASGGIRDAATARRMIEAGASRLGASASLRILAEWGAAQPA